ncbi:sensor histidine kinase [Roseivirga sp.]|uniref:sensor histidine kinase n=1 Tax=Roseivirga sp. TaxID=1964215 RepID=UPI003B8D99A4
MAFNRFSILVAIRLVLIGATMFAGIWSFFETDSYMSPIGFSVLTLAQFGMLFYFINQTRKDLLVFFKSFDNRDFNKAYTEHVWGQSKDELKVAFNNVLKTFKTLSLEREEQYQYLKLINEHVSVGLISYKSDGRIDLMNKSASQLLGVPPLGKVNQLENHDPVLWEQIQSLAVGEQTVIVPTTSKRKLAVANKRFKLAEEDYTLISFQDISAELEEREMDAWQKLIRVLTHEIMNSVTPVVSLTTAVKMIMQDEKGKLKAEALPREDLEDVFKSMVAIEKRGQGLLGFVKAYRDYTRPPVPEIARVNLFSWLNDTLQIYKTEMDGVTVNIDRNIAEDHFIEVDEKLMSQVFINLLKNAAEAMKGMESPHIDISANYIDEKMHLSITDNGPGIPLNILDEVFVPFFTTKTEGNGIGLSLSKQIMKAHRGDITVESGSLGTKFTLKV